MPIVLEYTFVAEVRLMLYVQETPSRDGQLYPDARHLSEVSHPIAQSNHYFRLI